MTQMPEVYRRTGRPLTQEIQKSAVEVVKMLEAKQQGRE